MRADVVALVHRFKNVHLTKDESRFVMRELRELTTTEEQFVFHLFLFVPWSKGTALKELLAEFFKACELVGIDYADYDMRLDRELPKKKESV